ncbi:MAG: DUF448 domain-containing protein [Erythrobacter sp.]|jgi:predicted RNA-binding protein YlxR (DUF448 family)|nr:DUF448 domain-containing protein [Erythrobacter sp.]
MRTSPNERLTSDIPDAASSPVCASERRCILTGEVRPREELVRLALSPTGEVLPDPGAKAPGRGAWIAPTRAGLEAAIADGHFRRALMRAFKGGPEGATISFPDDLPERIETALRRHLLDRLGLELRGGNIVLGSSRIEEQARGGLVALLAHASDASEGSRRKLDQAWRVGMDREGSGLMGMVLPLDRTALSVALGRDNVVHLGVLGARRSRKGAPDAAARIALATMRLARFIGSDPALPALDHAGEPSAPAGGDTDNT